MNESFLLRLSLATGIIGICALLAVLWLSDIDEDSINDVKAMQEGKGVKISGSVERISVKGNVSIITLAKKELLTVVAFQNISLKKGDSISVTGEVQEYNGGSEIVADKIVKT